MKLISHLVGMAALMAIPLLAEEKKLEGIWKRADDSKTAHTIEIRKGKWIVREDENEIVRCKVESKGVRKAEFGLDGQKIHKAAIKLLLSNSEWTKEPKTQKKQDGAIKPQDNGSVYALATLLNENTLVLLPCGIRWSSLAKASSTTYKRHTQAAPAQEPK